MPSFKDYDSWDVAVTDVNGDGWPDLLFANLFGRNQLLLNQGDGTFEEAADLFPLDYSETHSVAFADFNNDGWLDIVLGNHDEPKQLLTFSQCPNGGATLHGSSWCFPCPHFMGRPQDSSGYEFSVCRECSPYFSHDAGPTSLSLINPLVSSVPPGRMVLRKAVHQRSVILVHLALVVFPVA